MYFDVFYSYLVLRKVIPNVYQVVYHVLKVVVQTYLRSRNVKDYIRTVSNSEYKFKCIQIHLYFITACPYHDKYTKAQNVPNFRLKSGKEFNATHVIAQWDENRKSVRFLEKNWNLFFSPEPQIRSCTDDIDYMRPASAASEAIS